MKADPVTSRRQAEDVLIRRAQQDETFRRELLTDPNGAIGRALGVRVPADVKIHVVEETPRQLYLVIPPKGTGSGELAQHELNAVAGGALASSSSSAWTKIGPIVGGGGIEESGA
jgi:hypothetical protein